MNKSESIPHARLSRLAINEEGFVFDPQTGESFTVNTSGGMIIKFLAKGSSKEEIAEALVEAYNIKLNDAHSDVRDFVDQLRFTRLM
jgi:hypothetical protein